MNDDAKTWAMACHLGALATYTGMPFAGLIVPVVIWLLKRDDDPYIDYHGREAVNFQITMTIIAVVCFLLVFVVIGFFLLPLLGIFNLIMVIVAAIKAKDGEHWRYPLTLRIL